MVFEEINQLVKDNDFEFLKNLISSNSEYKENYLWSYAIHQAIKFDSKKEMLELISKELYTIDNILIMDDVDNLPKITNTDQAIEYFEKGESKIKNFIIDNYPQFIVGEFFDEAAISLDLNLLKKINSLYQGKEKIDWVNIAKLYIENSEEDQLEDFDDFFNFVKIDFKENAQMLLVTAIKAGVETSIQYFLDRGADLNVKFEGKMPIEATDSSVIKRFLKN